MDGGRFDAVARGFAARVDRRAALRGAVALLATLPVGDRTVATATAQGRPTLCISEGERCKSAGAACCVGLACAKAGKTKSGRTKRRCKAVVPVCAGTYERFAKGPLKSVYGIAVGADGAVSVADPAANAIVRYTDPRTATSGAGIAGGAPLGLALGQGGDLYVGDFGAGVIYSRDAANAVKTNPWATAQGVAYLARDANGSTYATRPNAGKVAKFDAAGNQIAMWSVCEAPAGIAVGPGGHVYVACNATGGVTAYDADSGSALFSFGVPGNGQTSFDDLPSPWGIAFDGTTGYVSQIDPESRKRSGGVKRFTVDAGAKRATMTCAFPLEGKNFIPLDLAVDGQGRVLLGLPVPVQVARWTATV